MLFLTLSLRPKPKEDLRVELSILISSRLESEFLERSFSEDDEEGTQQNFLPAIL